MKYISSYVVGMTFLKGATSFKISYANIKSWSIVFFGSDFYSLFCLKALHSKMVQENIGRLEVVVVNNKSPVYEYSISKDIKTHLWPPVLSGSYDFGVTASFGKLIPKNIIEQFKLGIINVHGSLLPKYRGGMPMTHAIKNGDTSTGVTITRIREDKFDVGEIILQKPCVIGRNELLPSLYKRMMYLGSESLLEVISNMPNCLDSSFPQSDREVSYAPKLKKEDAVVRWNEMTSVEIYNLYRALFGTLELTSTWKEKQVKFVCMFLSEPNSYTSKDTELEPGSFTYNKKSKFLYVQCKDKPITVCTLKYRNKMYKASSFHMGYLHSIQRSFWKFKS